MTHRRETRPESSPLSGLASRDLELLRAGLRLMALRLLGDPDAAEEAAQETLTRTLCAIQVGQIDDVSKVGAFARGVARHVIVDQLRARGRNESLETVAEEAQGGPDPLELAVTNDEHQRVRFAIERLDPTDRELLRLSFFEGHTPLQIAALTGEPAERIRKRKSRALERLRDAFLGGAGGHDSDRGATEQKEKPGDDSPHGKRDL